MLSGEFERKVRRLNSNLRIFCGDNDSKAAGLFHVVNGEYEQIIGVDKNMVPERIIYDKFGHILKSGWRRVVKNLIKRKLVDQDKAEKVFNFHYIPRWQGGRPPTYTDPIKKEIDTITKANLIKTGKPFLLSTDEMMDIASEIRRKDDNAKH